jgi:general secretion pathway protein G
MSIFSRYAARKRALTRQAGRSAANELGMSLIEIMVVMAIIGLLVGGVAIVATGQLAKAKVTDTKKRIAQMKTALQFYANDHSNPCPKDLTALKDEKLVKGDVRDPWGREFIFTCPGEKDKEGADLSSMGKDGKEGTDDDINSWDLE